MAVVERGRGPQTQDGTPAAKHGRWEPRPTREKGRVGTERSDSISRKKSSIAGTREQTQCRFCRRGDKYIDYKDIETLSRLLTNRGKIYSRKRSGNCAGCQRKVKKAIKRARYMALLPFVT